MLVYSITVIMSYCTSIKNILTKKQFKCNLKVNDINKFLYDMFEYQPAEILYLYKFDNGEKYITAYRDKDFLIEQIEDEFALKVIEHIYDVDSDNKEKRVNRIADNMIIIAKQQKMNVEIDKNKICDFLRQLDNNPLKEKVIEARDEYINKEREKQELAKKEWIKNQEGGVIIWALETYLFPKLPNIMQTILFGILEIIDILFMIASSIPFAIFPPLIVVEVIIDIISLIWSILRFDVISIVGSIISFIPYIGGTIGSVVKIIGKVYKYFKKAKKVVGIAKSGTKIGRKGMFTARDVARDTFSGKLSAQSFKQLKGISGDALGMVSRVSAKGPKSQKALQALTGVATVGSMAEQYMQPPEQYNQEYYEQPEQYE